MRVFRLQDCCSIGIASSDDGMPRWANLVASKTQKAGAEMGLAGAGVYACFWDEALIYIGSFVGPEEDPFGGSVIERIYKHVLGFTLRAKALRFRERVLNSIIAK